MPGIDPTHPSATLQYDRIKFAGTYLSPGLCKIDGGAHTNRWDIAQGVGIVGGTATFMGSEVPEFSVTFELYDDADWSDWDLIAPIFLERQRTPSWSAMDIEHPFLAAVGITSCVVKSVGQPVMQDETGIYTIKIDFISAPRRPQLQIKKVEDSKATAGDAYELEADKQRQGVRERLHRLGVGDDTLDNIFGAAP